MRRTVYLALLALFTIAYTSTAQADCPSGYALVQASKIQALGGVPLASGTFSITAVDANRQQINFGAPGGGAVIKASLKSPVANGAITAQVCVPRSDLSSVYVRYHIVVNDTSSGGSHAAVIDANDIPITTSVFSLDGYNFPANAYANPPNVLTSSTLNGDLHVTGTIYGGTIAGATAVNATHATTADTATTAVTATTATNASHATVADSAATATTATTATTASFANTATTAATATALATAPRDCGSQAATGINADGSPKACITATSGGGATLPSTPAVVFALTPSTSRPATDTDLAATIGTNHFLNMVATSRQSVSQAPGTGLDFNMGVQTQAAADGADNTYGTFLGGQNYLGWNYGNGPNVNRGWSGGKGLRVGNDCNTRGICEQLDIYSNFYTVNHSVGDKAGIAMYNPCDGGSPDYSAEGCNGITVHAGETPDYFHGLVTAGAAAGTRLLPYAFDGTITTANRSGLTDGSYLLDLNDNPVAFHYTSAPTLIPTYHVSSATVDATLVPSVYGNITCDMPQPVEPPVGTGESSITCTINNILNGAYTVGTATIEGDPFPSHVNITAVGALSSGSQSVTFSYRDPHAANQVSLWQGGSAGRYQSSDRSVAYNGWYSIAEVAGAIDSHTLAGNLYGQYLPNTYVAPRGLYSITKSGSIVTALFTGSNTDYTWNHLASAVISGCSDAGINGVITNLVLSNNGQTLTGTQTGGGTGCATAGVSLPDTNSAYHLFSGAEVTRQPANAGIANLEWNNVNWTSGDHLVEPHHPVFRGNGTATYFPRTTSDIISDVDGLRLNFTGAGASGAGNQMMHLRNFEPPTSYIGDGGWMMPVPFIKADGTHAGLALVDSLPLPSAALIGVNNCYGFIDGVTAGDCGQTHNILRLPNGGDLRFRPDINKFFSNSDWSVNKLEGTDVTTVGSSSHVASFWMPNAYGDDSRHRISDTGNSYYSGASDCPSGKTGACTPSHFTAQQFIVPSDGGHCWTSFTVSTYNGFAPNYPDTCIQYDATGLLSVRYGQGSSSYGALADWNVRTLKISGTAIASTNLSDNSNLAHLNTVSIFTVSPAAPDPVNATDVANKEYVDNKIATSSTILAATSGVLLGSNLATGADESVDVTVTGAVVGNPVSFSPVDSSFPAVGIQEFARVITPGVVRIVRRNPTAATIATLNESYNVAVLQ